MQGRNPADGFVWRQLDGKHTRMVVARVIADGPVPMGPIVCLYNSRECEHPCLPLCRPGPKSACVPPFTKLKPIQAENADLLALRRCETVWNSDSILAGSQNVSGLDEKLCS